MAGQSLPNSAVCSQKEGAGWLWKCRRADRPGVHTCLQIGDAQRRVFGAPIWLVGVDPQLDPGSDYFVVRARPLWGRPLRQIARNPSFPAQPGTEVIIDVRFTIWRGGKAPREGRHER